MIAFREVEDSLVCAGCLRRSHGAYQDPCVQKTNRYYNHAGVEAARAAPAGPILPITLWLSGREKTMANLGRLSRIDPREIWKAEAADFTPAPRRRYRSYPSRTR
jgi:hypothetical protein